MRLFPCLVLALVTTACSSGAKADLENVRTARSLLAELALLAEQHPSSTYTRQMQAEAARQLAATAAESRRSGGTEGAAIADIATVPANADIASLEARANQARGIEQRLAVR